MRVDHFREEEILTRPQYAAAAREFQATGTVELATLLSATRLFVDSILAGAIDVVIADALMPYMPSPLAWGHSDQGMPQLPCPGPMPARTRAGWTAISASSLVPG
jgi:hypothetical protein